ncbi:hypothetical protein [Microbacterium sp. CFBP9034]|uniref:hypothetical protein n=1 Tax=Microbacterium sp. CFBP9034 TaxID=3096540 RepID=UPI002A6A90B1|nr:hypothetical protein [Microbacterium sp. CFBP9034]MDY0910497.1 hypothetical protein [Microbacterium sp. CFBP9034]
MDASTFVVARLNDQRARELDRDLAHLASQAQRPADVAHPAPVRALWRRLTVPRRRTLPADERARLTLAGPAS